MADVSITTELAGIRQVEAGLRDLESKLRGVRSSLGGATGDTSRAAKETSNFGNNVRRTRNELSTFDKTTAALSATVRRLVTAYLGFRVIKSVIVDSALLNARFETMGIVMTGVGRLAGYSQQQMEGFEVSLRKTGIAMIEAREVITRMAQAQLDLTKSSELARIAQDAAVIGNINSSQAFERLVHGIQSGQTEILRTIGITVSFQQAYEKLAKELNTTTENLTESQKAQARMNEVLEFGSRIAGTYEAAMGTAAKQIQSMRRYVDDLKVKFGETFNEGLTIAVFGLTEQFKTMNGELDILASDKKLQEWGRNANRVMTILLDSISAVSGGIMQLTSTLTVGIAQLGALARGDLASVKAYGQAWSNDFKQYLDGIGSFQRSAESFYAKKDAQQQLDLTRDKRYHANLLEVRKAYANESLAVQQAAVQQLYNAYYPETVKGAPPPSTLLGGNIGKGKGAKADPLAPLKSMRDELQRSIATFGMSEDAAKLWNLQHGEVSRISGKAAAALRDQNAALIGTLAAKERATMLADDQAAADEHLMDTLNEINQQTNDYKDSLREQASAMEDAADPAREYIRELERIGEVNKQIGLSSGAMATAVKAASDRFKSTTDEMTEFAKQAARNMQDAMSEFFFDAFQGKLGNLADSFKRTIDKMVADLIASKLNNFLLGDFGKTGQLGGALGGGGFGNVLGGLFGSTGGAFGPSAASSVAMGSLGTNALSQQSLMLAAQQFQSGGSFNVGGIGGPDSQLVAFKATPGERVQVGQPKDMGAGVTFNFNVTTPDANSFRRSQGQLIAEAATALQRARRNM